MENSQTNYTPNKLEIIEMFRIDAGVGIDLEGIIVVSGIFEEAVKRIKHFVGKQEKKFSVCGVSLEFEYIQ